MAPARPTWPSRRCTTTTPTTSPPGNGPCSHRCCGSRLGRVDAAKRDGVGLALSGGGYRAMLFHAGALWRLNELGWLPKLTTVSSVSGGSIAAGVLAHAWQRLYFGDDGVAENFGKEVVQPLR